PAPATGPGRRARRHRRGHPERGGEPRRGVRGGGGGGTRQVCASCGSEHPETDPHARCPACRGLLEIRHDPPPQGGNALRALFDARAGVRRGPLASGVWRFTEAVLPTAGQHVLSYPEGNTPLLTSAPVAAWTGTPG